MAKTAKPRKRAAPASPFANVALRTTTIRVGGAAAIFALGLGLLYLNERRQHLASRAERPVVATVAPTPPAAPAPVRAVAIDEPAPAPRETPADSFKPMPVAVRASFDAWLMTTYAKCWRAPRHLPDGDPYAAKVRVAFHEDGTLAGAPKLVNPPADPAWKAHAEAAVKAVKSCDPLHVPDKYAEYYPSWKSRTVYFDPTRK